METKSYNPERLGRLRRFLSPHLSDLILSADGEALLESHRRQIAVLSCHLPGFEALVETAVPEDVLALLGEYHGATGPVIFEHEGTVGPLVGDRLTVYFNDPLPVDNPSAQAVTMAFASCIDGANGFWQITATPRFAAISTRDRWEETVVAISTKSSFSLVSISSASEYRCGRTGAGSMAGG